MVEMRNNMKSKKSLTILLALSALLLLPACIDINKQFSEVTDRIISKMGDDYKTYSSFVAKSMNQLDISIAVEPTEN